GRPPARAVVNSPAVLLNLACAGRGIAAFSEVLAEPQVKAGQLVRVLPGWCLPAVDAWLVFPGRRLMPAKSRAFIDLMIERLGKRCAELEARAQRGPGPAALPGAQKPPQEI
ncbi:MAG TPA: LysR substrate-binding domain-containing protein, partial [Methylibium sp.]